ARNPVVLGLTGTMFCGFMAQMILQSVWALHNQSRFGWTLRQVGLSLMVAGVATALVQGVLVRAVTPRFGERNVLLAGVALVALSHVGFALADRGWLIYVILLPYAL